MKKSNIVKLVRLSEQQAQQERNMKAAILGITIDEVIRREAAEMAEYDEDAVTGSEPFVDSDDL